MSSSNDSMYHLDVREPLEHSRLDNFVKLVHLTVRVRNTSLEEHLESCHRRESYIPKTNEITLLNCCFDDAINKRAIDAQYRSIFCNKLSDSKIKSNFVFVWDLSAHMAKCVKIYWGLCIVNLVSLAKFSSKRFSVL